MKNYKSFNIINGTTGIAAGSSVSFNIANFTLRENIVIKEAIFSLSCFDSSDNYRSYNRATINTTGILNYPAGSSFSSNQNSLRVYVNENKDGRFKGNLILTTGSQFAITAVVNATFLLNDKATASILINYISY